MAPYCVRTANTDVSTVGQRVVVAGATGGIGLGIALQFAKTGAEVWVIGRNPVTGNEVVEKLKEAAPPTAEGAAPPHFRFFQADLNSIKENLRVADEVADAAGEAGIDHLILTQGGPANPNDIAPNADGFDRHFSIQIVSRYILASHLTLTRPTVKRSVLTVAIAGMGKASFDVNDMTLEALKKKGGYSLIPVGARDCTMIDAIWEELAERNPSVRFLHLYPGVVKTPALNGPDFTPTLRILFKAGALLVGNTIEEYAHTPFYLIANPEGQKEVGTEASATHWNEKPKRLAPSPALKKPETRKAVWDFMVSKVPQ